MKKMIGLIILFVLLVCVGKYVYTVHVIYNIKEISKNKVYKSGVIPPEKIKDYVKKYNIKSIIDLRKPGTEDLKNNPERVNALVEEKNAVEKITGVNYFALPSDQVPEQEVLDQYFQIMDNPDNYPVLMHCHHGEGRAPLFAALYQIEYEGLSNEEARSNTRFLVKWTSFDNGKKKGEFLKNYISRKNRKVVSKQN